jgi:hypothetical protein
MSSSALSTSRTGGRTCPRSYRNPRRGEQANVGFAATDALSEGLGPRSGENDGDQAEEQAKANADLITDFTPKVEAIELAKSVFKKLKLGELAKKRLPQRQAEVCEGRSPDLLQEEDRRLLVRHKTQGGKGDVLIATLDKKLDLSHDDIVVA